MTKLLSFFSPSHLFFSLLYLLIYTPIEQQLLNMLNTKGEIYSNSKRCGNVKYKVVYGFHNCRPDCVYNKQYTQHCIAASV